MSVVPVNVNKNKIRFRVGVALIGISYPLWGAAFVAGGFELRGGSFPWWRVAAVLLVLNWIAFGLGILLAGREAVKYFSQWVFRLFSSRTAFPDDVKGK